VTVDGVIPARGITPSTESAEVDEYVDGMINVMVLEGVIM
jgi:hypothetical protein